MVRTALSRAGGDVADTKRRIAAALDRYSAFTSAIRRGDVSAQASGAKVLDNLASIAVQDQLLLRNSADLRRFFSTAISRIDLAAMLSSSSAPIQLATVQASSSLSQHAETLPSTSLPCLVKMLQSDGASELAVITLRNLVRHFGPSTIWQSVHDGEGHETLLAKAEAWAQGHAQAVPHLRLLCHLLHSSLAAQRHLLQSPKLAVRWATALLELLQLSLPDTEREVVAATLHAMSAVAHFVEHIQQDCHAYHKLAVAAAAAVQAGNRVSWTGASNLESLTVAACNLLDTLACITPPHVHQHQGSNMKTTRGPQESQNREEVLHSPKAQQQAAERSLASALRQLLAVKRFSIQPNSPGHRVLSAALKAICVLLLPPHFSHGLGARQSPWVVPLGSNLTTVILSLLSKSRQDFAMDTWCWQALYLLQAQLSASQISQILQHPTLHQKIPPTSILTLEPLYCSWSAFRLALACQATVKPPPHLTHSVYLPATDTHGHQSPSAAPSHGQASTSSSTLQGSRSQWAGQESIGSSALQASRPQWAGQESTGSSALQASGHQRADREAKRQQWAKGDSQRHHLLLPKALPQGNLMRYFDLACVTAALRCLDGQQGAWEDAWLVLMHALPRFHDEDGAAWTSAIIAALQSLTEAAAMGCLPTDICQELLHLSQDTKNTSREMSTVLDSLPPEVAYGDASAASSGSKGTLVPPPLQQQENAQLQLWWAAATAACSGRLALPSELGETLSSLLGDSSLADVAINLQDPSEIVWAHASILAARCPKLYEAAQQQQQQQQLKASTSSTESDIIQLHLGKQVKASALRQVLEYVYTGQVKTLASSEEKIALRKLAHALDLPQLAALAAGTKPLPGASYAPLTLCALVPSSPIAIPYKAELPMHHGKLSASCHQDDVGNMTGCDSQLASTQPEHHHADTGQVGPPHALSQQEHQQLDLGQVGLPHASQASLRIEASNQVEGIDEADVTHQQHPRLNDMLGSSLQFSVPARLLRPSNISTHFDLLLVPQQRQFHAHSKGDTTCGQSQQESRTQHEVAQQDGYSVNSSSSDHRVSSTCSAAGGQSFLQVLPAHRAVLAVTSPYFAAMLSDRWQAGHGHATDFQQMSVAHLPSYDMDVLLAFVHFCCTRELKLLPRPQAALADDDATRSHRICGGCWQSRTAVRLSSAAEAWMVPQLQQECVKFLSINLDVLSADCQAAVYQDLSELQTWGLAQDLADSLS